MTQPYLIMSIIVRDEVDIIAQNLEWHREQGVDRFVIIDHGSTDGTSTVLRYYANRMPIDLIRRKDDVVDQVGWNKRTIRTAFIRYRHCWHIANDADEFWIPPAGETLKTYLSRQKDDTILLAERRNVIFAREDLENMGWRKAPCWQSTVTLGIPKGIDDPKVAMDYPHEYYQTPGKVVFKPDSLLHLNKGAHSAQMNPPCEPAPSALQILHFPFRDTAEFLDSARRLGQSANLHQPRPNQRTISGRYRRWLAMMEQGTPTERILDEVMPRAARLQADAALGHLESLTLPADLRALLERERPLRLGFADAVGLAVRIAAKARRGLKAAVRFGN